MAGTGNTGGKKAGINNINITPMVDVLLVLLVIMMASAQYIVYHSLNLELPQATTADEEGGEATLARVTIESDGALSFNGEYVNELVLRGRLSAFGSSTPDPVLVIGADRHTEHGMVVHVLDMARQVGLTNISLQVVEEDM